MARESAIVLCLTCRFVLLVVTCCSSPATRAINLFKVGYNEASLEVGILGLCFGSSGGPNVRGRSSCSPSILGFQIIMGTPRAGNSPDIGYSTGSLTDVAIVRGSGAQIVANEDLTRAMIFTPLSAAVSGLSAIFCMAAWASRGERQMHLVAIIMSAITAVSSWIAFAINMAISAKVKQGIDELQPFIPSGANLYFVFGAATFLPLGAAMVVSAALGWSISEYRRGKPSPERRDSAATAVSYDRAWSEKQIR